jgi:TorA maturation chaperone TorD
MTEPISASSALDEETARAEIYGLLAHLYYAPPAPELLAQLRVAATDAPAAGGFLEEPWRELVGAARQADDTAIASEFNALFGGVGKPEVYLFGSHYLSGAGPCARRNHARNRRPCRLPVRGHALPDRR